MYVYTYMYIYVTAILFYNVQLFEAEKEAAYMEICLKHFEKIVIPYDKIIY